MSILQSLFRRAYDSSSAGVMDIHTAHRIVQDYGDFLQTSSPLPGCVADVKLLPHSKNRIKDAIGVYVNTIGEDEITEDLKHGYLMLSAWQNGVGERTLGLDFTQIDLDEDPLLVAEMIQRQSDSISKWKPLIEADQIDLMSEYELLTA